MKKTGETLKVHKISGYGLPKGIVHTCISGKTACEDCPACEWLRKKMFK